MRRALVQVLSDEQKRSMYDQFGEAGLQGEYDGSGGGSQGVRFSLTSKFQIS